MYMSLCVCLFAWLHVCVCLHVSMCVCVSIAKAFMGSQPLAKRVFFLVPDTGISLCDYILSSETEAAVQERVREWAGFTIPDGQLHITQQLVQGRLEWHQGRLGTGSAPSMLSEIEPKFS